MKENAEAFWIYKLRKMKVCISKLKMIACEAI